MMTSHKAGAQTGSSGCGCGGSGASGCGCGKGTASYSQPAHSTTFLRPRFFPGQLLTEDDLEQLVSYTMAKNRLHNRFLFGEGVVAGLQVHKHPNLNSKGLVRVSAGYALDSQGNDIVVPCPHDLDINKLVRDLVQARMGRECEPVPPPVVVDPIERDARDTVAEEPPPKPTRRYALYLRYHEQPTEPTAPYTTGEDACAAQACQFARVQEGYLFELRCYEGPPGRSGFLEALAKCGAAGQERAVRAEDIEWLTHRAREMGQAVQRLPAVDVAVAVEGQLRGNYVLTPRDVAQAEELSQAGVTASMSVKEGALRLENMASLVARYDMRSNPEETHESFETLRAQIQGEDGAGLADKVLSDARSADLSPLERKTVSTIAQAARRWTRAERAEGWGTSSEHRLLAAGTVLNPELQSEYQTVTRGVLKGADTQVARPVEARERKAAAVGTAPKPVPAELEDSDIRYTAASLEQLASEYQKLLRECMCEALHPPFAPPGDPAVLLARLDVRECEVVDICNMERQLVLSPAAAQYWVGSALREQLEKACCGPRDGALGDSKRARLMMDMLMRMYGQPQAAAQAPAAPAAASASGTLRANAEVARRVVKREGTTEARAATSEPAPAAPAEASAAKTAADEAEAREEAPVTPSPARTRRGGSRGGGRRG